VRRIGLTGGIGAGKSTVARRLVELGAVVVDADLLARAALEPGSDGFDAVLRRFGDRVLGPDGGLDREALGSIVFGDEDARRDLEGIVHPLVRAEAARLEAEAVAANPAAVVVHDIPLLVETGQAGTGSRFDVVVVVDAPAAEQRRRLVAERGMTEETAHARMAAQATPEQRRAVADVVLANDGTPAQLRDRVDELWRSRLSAR